MKKCKSCKKFKTCKELCPEKEIFVSQDSRNYFNPKEHIVSDKGIILESDRNQMENYLERIYEENEIGNNKLRDRIKKIVKNEFNIKFQRVCILRYKENLTLKEIAKILGYKGANGVHYCLKSAIKRFKLKLEAINFNK